jgi:3alpha(or 20beta)-hydroxysteroid dehydrogenase
VNATPLKRIGVPLDIAKGIAFLASSDAQFITGTNLVIDGGIVHNITDSVAVINSLQ